jgi:hypothetical protein
MDKDMDKETSIRITIKPEENRTWDMADMQEEKG